jgi:hypothetical protein
VCSVKTGSDVIQFTVHGILGAMAPGINWPGGVASSAKINNAWNYTCTPPYVFMVLCSNKHGNDFTLLFNCNLQY